MGAADVTDGHQVHGVQVVLLVPDVAAALDFYRDQLGFHIDFVVGNPPIHARVYSGDNSQASAARIRFEKSSGSLGTEPGCYLFIHVGSDIDGLFQSFVARNVEVVQPPEDRAWGARVFIIRDLNGHRLEFVAPFDD
jgi:uncharacterized glyoxalase superfamily protein PhnB